MGLYTNFKALKRPSSPNYFLACPTAYCNINPNVLTPVYPISISRLRALWLQVISLEPRWLLMHTAGDHLEYVQRSRLFHFPDFISVCLIDIDQKQSSIAILSRSQYGYYDFGVNRKRVMRLLGRLDVKK